MWQDIHKEGDLEEVHRKRHLEIEKFRQKNKILKKINRPNAHQSTSSE